MHVGYMGRYLKQAKSARKKIHRFSSLALADFKRQIWHQYFPNKPQSLNLLANDICNSRCTMCNIWKQKLDFELSPSQLRTVLSDKLFTEITAVGITGGEPTLRVDLPDLYEACCLSLPKLKNVAIITNAVNEADVIDRISRSAETVARYGKRLGVMVSLDGYGEVHDSNRRRPGNFESALNVINYFRQNTDLHVLVGCTVTKNNVWNVDELLDFLIAENIYGRFRVAEFITRLYNEDLTESIRNFTDEELYHLICFFKRLELTFEKNPTYQRTYRSIQQMLSGGPRQIGCPYHSEGVVLTSKGEILYCAPKSPVLGSGLNESPWTLFKVNLAERRRILKENCSDCIHDYHAPITFSEQWEEDLGAVWERLMTREDPTASKRVSRLLGFFPKKNVGRTKVLITGWYGTETVGDKAILGAILEHYHDLFGNQVEFTVSSFYPFVTVRTLKELGKEARVIHVNSFDFVKACSRSNYVVIGGGPLMEIKALLALLSAFRVADAADSRKVVFGCGLGPIYSPRYTDIVKEILLLADEVKLRDRASISWAEHLTGRNDIECSGDPAAAYIKHIAHESPAYDSEKRGVLACFLREFPYEYRKNMPKEDFIGFRTNFERGLADAILSFCSANGLTPCFYSMHTFVVGGDDRAFYRRFVRTYFSDYPHYVEHKPSSVDRIVESMLTSRYNLCMRFHSVLFAHTLGINYIAIDYTNGGKIAGFLRDQGSTDRMIPAEDLLKVVDLSEAFERGYVAEPHNWD